MSATGAATERFIPDQLYYVQHHVKDTWGHWGTEDMVVLGRDMRHRGYHLEPHWIHVPQDADVYRLNDGHLPAYQSQCLGATLRAALLAGDGQCAYPA